MMQPCSAKYQDPSKFSPVPVAACAPGPVGTTVTDRVPAPIDHVALSVGRPDGLYVAGKQLRPWVDFDTRHFLFQFRCNPHPSAADQRRFKEIVAACAAESVVVRWRIENGHPGAAEPMTTHDGDGNERVTVAYIWGKQRHRHVYQLGYDLIRLAGAEMRAEAVLDAVLDAAYDRAHEFVASLAPEFVLPIADICRIIAAVNLERAKAALAAAEGVAKHWGSR